MEFFKLLYNLFRHLGDDSAWQRMIDYIGQGNITLLVVAIVFCETGLVILPFLPGDSLLFAIGAVGARGLLEVPMLVGLLITAALVGDNVNYWAGRKIGPGIFKSETSKLLNRKHLIRAQEFYAKHGTKTVILARFVPIIRTFAPFVAGVGRMNYGRFLVFSVIGAIAWVNICVWAGYWFGGYEFIKKHFELVLLAIIFISVIPVIIEFLKARTAEKRGVDPLVEATTLEKVE